MWSKIKEFLRAAAAHTEEALYEAIRLVLQTVSKTDIKNWFKFCGYLACA